MVALLSAMVPPLVPGKAVSRPASRMRAIAPGPSACASAAAGASVNGRAQAAELIAADPENGSACGSKRTASVARGSSSAGSAASYAGGPSAAVKETVVPKAVSEPGPNSPARIPFAETLSVALAGKPGKPFVARFRTILIPPCGRIRIPPGAACTGPEGVPVPLSIRRAAQELGGAAGFSNFARSHTLPAGRLRSPGPGTVPAGRGATGMGSPTPKTWKEAPGAETSN